MAKQTRKLTGKRLREPIAERVTPAEAPTADIAPEHAEPPPLGIDERVAEVFSAPEPTEAPEMTAAKAWHQEAAEILALTRVGTPVSPGRVVAALSAAVGLVPR
jgi:hypothetical protein